MPDTRIHDPATGFRFQVQAQPATGAVSGGFSKVSGLRDETEVIEYREGTDPFFKTKHVGLRTFPDLVMERGMMIDATALVDWRQRTVRCQEPFWATIKVTVYNCDSEPARTAEFARAWPKALQLSDLDAGASEVNIESVEFVHEGKTFDTLFSRGGLADLRPSRGDNVIGGG
jgi:phage tail-like protein